MSDEPAKFILGGTAISSVEQPGSGRFFRRRKNQPPPLSHCENCGEQLTGHYCARCGQAAVDYRRSFRHVIGDIFDSFDIHSKIFGTAGLLVTRPWALTNEYLSGKRVRHVNPFKLYLFASIGFFFLVQYWTKDLHIPPGHIGSKDRAELAAQVRKNRGNIEAKLGKANLPPEARRKVQQTLDDLANPSPAATDATESKALPTPDEENASPNPDEPNNEGDYGPILQLDSNKPSTPFEKWIEAKAKEKLGEHGSKLGLFLATLFQNLPYMILCCIPLFALVLKILYVRRKIFYIDHLIYALHIHTFAFVAVSLIVLTTKGLNRFVPSMIGWIAVLWVIFAVQTLLSIRRVYRQGWFFSILKFSIGGFVYLIVLFVALLATFFFTLLA
jgi:hypothetical protein